VKKRFFLRWPPWNLISPFDHFFRDENDFEIDFQTGNLAAKDGRMAKLSLKAFSASTRKIIISHFQVRWLLTLENISNHFDKKARKHQNYIFTLLISLRKVSHFKGTINEIAINQNSVINSRHNFFVLITDCHWTLLNVYMKCALRHLFVFLSLVYLTMLTFWPHLTLFFQSWRDVKTNFDCKHLFHHYIHSKRL
jgi:hypothetical protein